MQIEKDSVYYKQVDIGYAPDRETEQRLATGKIFQKMLLRV